MAKKRTEKKTKTFSEAIGLQYIFNNTITDFFIGLALLSQLLKSPTTETFAALGAHTRKTAASPFKNEPKYLYASEVIPELKFLIKSFISHLLSKQKTVF